MNDLGSGTLVDLSRYGLKKEPTVREAVAEGADVVTFSGDKLLGGPQAGFIVGKRAADRSHQPQPDETRASRRQDPPGGDRSDAEALSRSDRLAERLPTLRLLARTQGRNRRSGAPPAARRAQRRWTRLHRGRLRLRKPDRLRRAAARYDPERRPQHPSNSGGGALERLAAALRGLQRPVIGRLEDGALVLDLDA